MAIETFDQGRIVLARRTTAVIVVVYAYIASWAFFIAASLGDMAGILPLGPESMSQMTALMGALAVLAMISSIIIVGMWIYRAHANLRLAGGAVLGIHPRLGCRLVFYTCSKPLQTISSNARTLER